MKAIPNLVDLPLDEYMQLEDRIMERALALWHKEGHAHRNAPDALLQVEREILAQRELPGLTRSRKFERASLTLKRSER